MRRVSAVLPALLLSAWTSMPAAAMQQSTGAQAKVDPGAVARANGAARKAAQEADRQRSETDQKRLVAERACGQVAHQRNNRRRASAEAKCRAAVRQREQAEAKLAALQSEARRRAAEAKAMVDPPPPQFNLEESIRARLAQLRSDLPKIRARLHAVPCGSETCYPAADVRDVVDEIRRRLRDAIGSEEAIALLVALDDEIKAVLTAESAPLDGNYPASLRSLASALGYLASATDLLLDRFEDTLDRLLPADLTPDISIRSTPRGASFEIFIPGTKKKRGCTTDDKVPALWRSVYQTVVRKTGYREVHYPLDLMNDARTKVVCTLVATNKSGTSTCRVVE